MTVPLDDGGWLDQHHCVQAARPQSVKPDPEQPVDRKQPGPTRSLAAMNMQLVTEGEVLQFQNGPTAETASNSRDDGTRMSKHAQNTMAAEPETLDFSAFSEFSVATGANALQNI